jgi:CheY-like chemotaxis protein
MYPNDLILVVEDDSDHYALLEEGFRRERLANALARVTTAREAIAYLNGEGAFAERGNHPLPCLVLLDLSLPEESGFAVLEWVRNHPNFKKLPVVVLTGSRDDRDLNRAYALGANSYLVKPFDIAEFRALVKSINAYWVLLAQTPRF